MVERGPPCFRADRVVVGGAARGGAGGARPSPPAAPSAATPAQPSDLPQVAFEKYTLANGLEVILHEDHRMPEIAVDVWYKFGARDEAPGRTGFAHLFEHVMFQGTKHIPEDKHFEYLQKAGESSVNGSTSHDRTNYFEVVRPTSWSWRSGWRASAWDSCWNARLQRRPSTTSATWSRTSADSATRTAPPG